VLGPFGFLTDNLLGGSDLVVRVDQGEVVISGVVSNRMAEQHVMAVAHGVPGVRILKNEIDVRNGTREDDLRLKLIIFRSMQYTVDLWEVWPAMQVEVRDGVARLRGRVKSNAQSDLATAVAASVRTILAVDNQLQIDPRLKLDRRAFDPSREPSTTITPDTVSTWSFGSD
jgi:osmotically-inducible protein OsmY